jgi:hypothetical protein
LYKVQLIDWDQKISTLLSFIAFAEKFIEFISQIVVDTFWEEAQIIW